MSHLRPKREEAGFCSFLPDVSQGLPIAHRMTTKHCALPCRKLWKPFLLPKHVNNPLYRSWGEGGAFLLCLHFVYLLNMYHIYIWNKDLFIFANPGCCITDPSGGSALGDVVSETPLLFVQRLAQSSSGESCLCCIYGGLLWEDGLSLFKPLYLVVYQKPNSLTLNLFSTLSWYFPFHIVHLHIVSLIIY